jgi:hypothetical protein
MEIIPFTVYIDKFGCVHTTREACIQANRTY